jgi:hypothetical protein
LTGPATVEPQIVIAAAPAEDRGPLSEVPSRISCPP